MELFIALECRDKGHEFFICTLQNAHDKCYELLVKLFQIPDDFKMQEEQDDKALMIIVDEKESCKQKQKGNTVKTSSKDRAKAEKQIERDLLLMVKNVTKERKEQAALIRTLKEAFEQGIRCISEWVKTCKAFQFEECKLLPKPLYLMIKDLHCDELAFFHNVSEIWMSQELLVKSRLRPVVREIKSMIAMAEQMQNIEHRVFDLVALSAPKEHSYFVAQCKEELVRFAPKTDYADMILELIAMSDFSAFDLAILAEAIQLNATRAVLPTKSLLWHAKRIPMMEKNLKIKEQKQNASSLQLF